MRLPPFKTLSWLLGFLPIIGLAELDVKETADLIVITQSGQPVLTYHKAVVEPPAGQDPLYARSGFIHPLHAPNGAVVTSIHAEDHYHHLGLWHPWTKTEFRGREVDFWNLYKGEGTVRFREVKALQRGGPAVGFTVVQEHVVWGEPEEVVLVEDFTVRVHPAEDAFVIDYETRQTNVADAPLVLPAYRYGGGIGFRARLDWGELEPAYLTSTGLERDEGHATRADWCAMQGPTEHGPAWVTIMNHPTNHDSPQRMRIWPQGHVFFNYVPTQEFDHTIEPGESMDLRYRIVVRDGGIDAAQAARDFESYTRTGG